MTEQVILHGDARAIPLKDESVQMVVTSPPYWGLRSYGVDGQIGLERTVDEYVSQIVAVFRDVRRVLRLDGTAWLNLGDTYSRNPAKGGSGPNGKHDTIPDYGAARRLMSESRGSSDGWARIARMGWLKEKDLIGVPWRVAFALQADGWYLRRDIIWHKPNPMPESVTDRPTTAHEFVFLLSKSALYFYDADAVREPDSGQQHHRNIFTGQPSLEPSGGLRSPHRGIRICGIPERNGKGRNLRSVWTIATQPFPGAHFATFPEALVEPMVLAGSRPGDVVLDPFAGSGTVGRVCRRLDRRFVGLDLNRDYCEMAVRRIAEPFTDEGRERAECEAKGQMRLWE